MDELTEITEYIQEKAGQDAEMIFGHGTDESLGQSIPRDGYCHRLCPRGALHLLAQARRHGRAYRRSGSGGGSRGHAQRAGSGQPGSAFRAQLRHGRACPRDLRFERPGGSQRAPAGRHPRQRPRRTGADLPHPRRRAGKPTGPAPAMDAQALERRRRLQELSGGLPPEAVSQYDTPAYLRRQVKLENVEPSSAQNISRFNLSDDNELLG